MDGDKYPDALKNLIGISKKTRNILLKVIEEFQKKHGVSQSGYIETELIRRFLRQSSFSKRKIREVEGPISVYQMSSDEYPQIFYLFGDNHIKKSDCGDITKFHTWIKDAIVNSPVFIDVYLETPYQYKDYPTLKHEHLVNSYIQDFYKDFKKCFVHFKNLPGYCQTSRFHYTDTRRIAETMKQRWGSTSSYEYIYEAKTRYKISSNVKEVNDYIDFILNSQSFLRKRIKKQFNAIRDDRIRDTIKREFAACLAKYKKGIRHLMVHEPDRFKALKVLWAISDYTICQMDYYLIARCFRSYGKKKGYSRPGYNNIIYAGHRHIKRYIKILQKLDFNLDAKVSPVRGDRLQCLDLSEIKQPLFHQRYKN
uniref:Uncharacterized protein n=1 Tax=Marseillevirus LCMAC101 TaxID=2506602 RepID=A0A481YR89_9VIRU|nr:MAG: hypothetical protein LCMAC101_00140 [Marseillevirus LCMAC101]